MRQNWPPILTCVILLGLRAGMPRASAGPLHGTYDYNRLFSENFDGMGNDGTMAPGEGTNLYWSCSDNGTEYAANLTPALDALVWGGTGNAAFNGRGSNTDRHLHNYKTASGETHHMTARFRNATGATMTNLTLFYDFESAWVNPNTNIIFGRSGGFTVYFQTNLSAGFPPQWFNMGTQFACKVTITNIGQIGGWKTDEEMDLQKTSIRNLGGTYSLPAPLEPGAIFYVRWHSLGTDTSTQTNKTVGNGLDNVRVGNVLRAAYPYQEGFSETFSVLETNPSIAPNQSGRTYWSVVVDEVETAESLVEASNDVPGNTVGGYNAWDGAGDRHLAVYPGATTGLTAFTCAFYNATNSTQTVINLRYDLKCAWADSTNPVDRTVFTLAYSSNSVEWLALGAAHDVVLTNGLAASTTNWLSGTDMLAGSLWLSGLGAPYAPPNPVLPGSRFYLRWSVPRDPALADLNVGLDNLFVPAYEPPPPAGHLLIVY